MRPTEGSSSLRPAQERPRASSASPPARRSRGAAVRSDKAAKETVVAYVEDHHGSTVTLLVGEREVVVHDRDLVTRILNAAGGE